jgi:hypothetical protein
MEIRSGCALNPQGHCRVKHHGDLTAVDFLKILLSEVLILTMMRALIKMLGEPFPSPSKKLRKRPERTPVSPRNQPYVQTVGVIGIDPEKLMKKLELKFPSDFEIHVGENLEHSMIEAG